jgi:hypothetical protein
MEMDLQQYMDSEPAGAGGGAGGNAGAAGGAGAQGSDGSKYQRWCIFLFLALA